LQDHQAKKQFGLTCRTLKEDKRAADWYRGAAAKWHDFSFKLGTILKSNSGVSDAI
jgi:hypothetical protein